MQIVITHLASEDRRERIYACQMIALRDEQLIVRVVETIMYFPVAEVIEIISVQTGERMRLEDLHYPPVLQRDLGHYRLEHGRIETMGPN